jgi:hypothetical protein
MSLYGGVYDDLPSTVVNLKGTENNLSSQQSNAENQIKKAGLLFLLIIESPSYKNFICNKCSTVQVYPSVYGTKNKKKTYLY